MIIFINFLLNAQILYINFIFHLRFLKKESVRNAKKRRYIIKDMNLNLAKNGKLVFSHSNSTCKNLKKKRPLTNMMIFLL